MAVERDPGGHGRRLRPDAQRSEDALLQAAIDVFAASGVDAPVREIAAKAGVGVGTFYRRFPKRSDLIRAVFQREIDACADAAPALADGYPPFEAIERWVERYRAFIAAKRGLAAALHSGDPAYSALPAYFDARLRPALQSLLDAAAQAGQIRPDVRPGDLLRAIASLSAPAHDTGDDYPAIMIGLLLDGMRAGRE